MLIPSWTFSSFHWRHHTVSLWDFFHWLSCRLQMCLPLSSGLFHSSKNHFHFPDFCGFDYAFNFQTQLPSSAMVSNGVSTFSSCQFTDILCLMSDRVLSPPHYCSEQKPPSHVQLWSVVSSLPSQPGFTLWGLLYCHSSDSSLLCNLSSLAEFSFKMYLVFHPCFHVYLLPALQSRSSVFHTKITVGTALTLGSVPFSPIHSILHHQTDSILNHHSFTNAGL